jgi:acyl-CoA thioester hydrolase
MHTHLTRVYYADTDAGGVVYHATYLAMAEQARTEALRAAGMPHAAMLAEHDRMFMVRRVKIAYLRPAKLDDMIIITTHALAETGATILLAQDFSLPDGAKLAALEVELVCVRASSLKPARIPPPWRNILSA